MTKTSSRGVTLVELLVALGIVGILAAIAIPMYLNAQNRARQSQTMANMRAVATAWEMRATDSKAYNAAGADFALPRHPLSYEDLGALLTPKYIPTFPRFDGWGHALEFRIDDSASGSARTYTIRSPGRDGAMQPTGTTPGTYREGAFDCFDCDIVFSNGRFVAWPAGAQK